MKKFPLLLLLAFLLPTAGRAATPAVGDLGQGLAYLRLKNLPADLAALPSGLEKPALVLDLRFCTADSAAADALRASLAHRATPRAPVLVLLNPDTAAPLRAAVLAAPALPGVVTLAPAAGGIAADITPDVSPTQDRAAYDAFDRGVTLADLTTVKIDKVRYDEAALEKQHRHDLEFPDEMPAPPDLAPPAKAAAQPAAPPLDILLQRAVQIHRAWLVLGRDAGS